MVLTTFRHTCCIAKSVYFLVMDAHREPTIVADANEENQSLLKYHASPQQRNSHTSFHFAYRFPKIHEKNIIFLLVWNLLFTTSLTTSISELLYNRTTMIEFPSLAFICPIIGLISDCWIGRFKILKAATYFLLVAIVLKGVIIITSSPVAIYLSVAIWSLTVGCYFITIIQFTIDQLPGASGEELSFIIYWLLWGFTTGILISSVVAAVVYMLMLSEEQILCATFAVSTTAFIICFVMMENCSYVLMTKPQIYNPIKQIAQVLNYARKHKFPEHRSALTYWEDDYPSRIDNGKNKYGGPFTFEEVEDVKTFLRLIPLVVCIAMSAMGCWLKDYHYSMENFFFYNETNIRSGIVAYLVAAFGLPAYHFIIYPLFYNHIPSMLRRIGLGIFMMSLSFLCNSIIEVVGHTVNGNITCMFVVNVKEGRNFPIDYWWTLIPNIIHGMGFIMVLYSTFEFVIAQTPCQIKGLSISVFLESFGIFSVIGEFVVQIFTSFPFELFLSCGFYYYMTFFVIMLTIFFLFVCISKWYPLRKRDDIVPYHALAENYFENNYYLENHYMKQYNSFLAIINSY